MKLNQNTVMITKKEETSAKTNGIKIRFSSSSKGINFFDVMLGPNFSCKVPASLLNMFLTMRGNK